MSRKKGTPNLRVDFNKLERLYRAGMLSLVEMAKECNIPEANIRYHAKKRNWKRDLTAAMRTAARTKLVENLAQVFDSGDALNKLKSVTDEQIIEEAARTQVQVVRSHQNTLGHGHSLTMRMLHELDATTTHRGEMEEMIKSTIAPRRQGAALAAISLPQRATTMRDLATAARLWVTLERQAFSIADDRDKDERKQKLDEMTAEQLRAEILSDAERIGLKLTPEDLSNKTNGVAARGNGQVH